MTIYCSLSEASISKAVKEIRKYKRSIAKKTERLVDDLGKAGVEFANLYLEHDDTGETRNSIGYTRKGKSCTISVGGAAVWIEFGTGVIANAGNSPHKKRDEVGAVPWGEYGKGYGKGIWCFPSKHFGGKWIPTAGIPMNPFMYSASQELKMHYVEFAREAFRID